MNTFDLKKNLHTLKITILGPWDVYVSVICRKRCVNVINQTKNCSSCKLMHFLFQNPNHPVSCACVFGYVHTNTFGFKRITSTIYTCIYTTHNVKVMKKKSF